LNICQRSATELARLIAAKDLSATEVVSAHLDRIAALNPKVNAIVTLTVDRALAEARAADEKLARGGSPGPLHGLPIAHKDLQEAAGIRTTFGSPVFADFIPDHDSPLVARLRHAGAITIGKTNTPEFGAGSQTFNPVFGATLNPYDLRRTCGGSSGGAAVALACGMLPIADGTDMGGSLRNPAAFCGVVGLRPTAGSVPEPPAAGSWSTLSVGGPMARTTQDVALLLAAMAGAPTPSLARDFDGVRVAWWIDLGGLPFDSAVARTVNAQRRAFQSLGCVVEAAEPDFTGADEIFKTLRARAFAEQHGETVRRHRGMVKDAIVWEVERGERLTSSEIDAAERRRAELQRRVRLFMERYEFFVLPTTQVPPFDVDQPFVTEINGIAMKTYIDWMKACYYVSVAGTPAISVPCGFTPDGLPVGLQIVGRHAEDLELLKLAHAFESVRGRFPLPSPDGAAPA
jgi:amidase